MTRTRIVGLRNVMRSYEKWTRFGYNTNPESFWILHNLCFWEVTNWSVPVHFDVCIIGLVARLLGSSTTPPPQPSQRSFHILNSNLRTTCSDVCYFNTRHTRTISFIYTAVLLLQLDITSHTILLPLFLDKACRHTWLGHELTPLCVSTTVCSQWREIVYLVHAQHNGGSHSGTCTV